MATPASIKASNRRRALRQQKGKRKSLRKTVAKQKRKRRPVSPSTPASPVTPATPSTTVSTTPDANNNNGATTNKKDDANATNAKPGATPAAPGATPNANQQKPKSKHHYKTIIFFMMVALVGVVYVSVKSGGDGTADLRDGGGGGNANDDQDKEEDTSKETKKATKNTIRTAAVFFGICVIVSVWRLFSKRNSKVTDEQISMHARDKENEELKDEDRKQKNEHEKISASGVL